MRLRFTIRLMRLIVTFCDRVVGAGGVASVGGGVAGEVEVAGAVASGDTPPGGVGVLGAEEATASAPSGKGIGRKAGMGAFRVGANATGASTGAGDAADVVSDAGAGVASNSGAGAGEDIASSAHTGRATRMQARNATRRRKMSFLRSIEKA
jgi:hypothetical protein